MIYYFFLIYVKEYGVNRMWYILGDLAPSNPSQTANITTRLLESYAMVAAAATASVMRATKSCLHHPRVFRTVSYGLHRLKSNAGAFDTACI